MAHRTGQLVDHLHLRVADLEASRRFYRSVLEALGLADTLVDADDHFHADELYVDRADGPVSHVHLAFRAADDAAVRRFHAAALAAGGRDNGGPGPRSYHRGYFAAFAFDPDGNNIEAVWHGAAAEAPSAGRPAPPAGGGTDALAAGRAEGAAGGGAERRRAERKPFRAGAELRFAGAAPLAVRTFDLSSSGLGVVAPVSLPNGLACTASLALPARPGHYATVELAATVIHSILAASEGGFKIGLQFATLPPEAMQAIARALRG